MTDEEINRQCAILHGKRPPCEAAHDSYPINTVAGIQLHGCKKCDCYSDGVQWHYDMPDYCCDRNATYELAQHLGLRVIKAMRFHLYGMLDQMTAHCASARMEAEAILMAAVK